MAKSANIIFRCEDTFKEKVELLAASENRKVSNYIENILIREIENMNNLVKKAKAMDEFDNSLPVVELGDTCKLTDVWDGEGDAPTDSYSYQLTDTDWINYCFEIVDEKADSLATVIKITKIELL